MSASMMTPHQINAYRAHNATVLRDLRPGDLVEFPRVWYSHWAVYEGDGKVIHLTAVDEGSARASLHHTGGSCCSSAGAVINKAVVCVDNFWKVADGCKAKKNNSGDNKHGVRSPQEILAAARSKIGAVGYNVLTKNCESFAKWCRYGVEKSEQGINAIGGIVGAVSLGIIGLAGLVYAVTRSNTQEELSEEED